jgi:DNA-binding HxlR family transcriptional regulator
MRGYRQFCPVAKAAEILTERWTPLVLRELLFGSRRFNDLRRGVPLMSPALLSHRLKFLAEMGVIERRRPASGKGWEYYPTSAGEELRPLVRLLGEWGQRWVRSQLTADELDPGWLMWDMRRNVDPRQFPSRRIVVQFEFSDIAQSKQHWWLVNGKDGVDLCVTDPGFEVDLYICSDVRTMTGVWMGDVSLSHAIDSGRLEVQGPYELRRSLRAWLKLSPVAAVRNQNHSRRVPFSFQKHHPPGR